MPALATALRLRRRIALADDLPASPAHLAALCDLLQITLRYEPLPPPLVAEWRDRELTLGPGMAASPIRPLLLAGACASAELRLVAGVYLDTHRDPYALPPEVARIVELAGAIGFGRRPYFDPRMRSADQLAMWSGWPVDSCRSWLRLIARSEHERAVWAKVNDLHGHGG